jgi:SAM-dependent methyltransferase
MEEWRNKNLYYYRDLEKFHCFVVQPNSSVFEIGSGLGYLLDAVQPSNSLGIDRDVQLVQIAQQKFSHLTFQIEDIEQFQPNQVFDYVLISNMLSCLQDAQTVLKNIRTSCHSSTRVVITFHNPAWEPILNFATAIGQRMVLPPLNWLSFEDVKNLLELSDFETVTHGKRLLFPKQVFLLSWFLNRIVAALPGFNQACLTEYIIARSRTHLIKQKNHLQTMTCSVIIPARNEAGNIENCILRMPRLGNHTEVIFIEGHSSDGTWQEIQKVQAQYSERWDIKISQQLGKGKGDAVRQGFEIATGDVLIILDADLTVKPEDLVHFFDAIASEHCELANGCRLIYPMTLEAMPWLNRIANRFFAWILSYVLGTRIKDSLCGTKAISKENYQRIAANRSYFGDFDPFGDFDLLLGAAKLGLKITDIPVRYLPRLYGKSNISHFKEGLILLKMCLYAAKKIKFI